MRKKCKCGGFDEDFEVVNEENIVQCAICGKLVCDCGLTEEGQKHYHSESEQKKTEGGEMRK